MQRGGDRGARRRVAAHRVGERALDAFECEEVRLITPAFAHGGGQRGLEHRQHGGDRLLGEELKAAEDDDEEADAVAEIFHQRTPRRVGEMQVKEALREGRGRHGEAGGDAGPP